jgi:cob(I)alamin adenosyltransferase
MCNSDEPVGGGRVHVYTGDGKGKTTAALGLVMRAAGAGMRVFIAQFCKGRPCSEHVALERFGDLVRCVRYGRPDFIIGPPTEQDRHDARRGLQDARQAASSGEYDLVVLDEMNVALHLGLLAVEDVLKLIESRLPHVEVVLTGRDAPAAIIARADLVTEMRAIKHYLDCGDSARRGIEL